MARHAGGGLLRRRDLLDRGARAADPAHHRLALRNEIRHGADPGRLDQQCPPVAQISNARHSHEVVTGGLWLGLDARTA